MRIIASSIKCPEGLLPQWLLDEIERQGSNQKGANKVKRRWDPRVPFGVEKEKLLPDVKAKGDSTYPGERSKVQPFVRDPFSYDER